MRDPVAPALADLLRAVDATWPAAAWHRVGPWLLREGRGGGKRVSAATAVDPVTPADIALAEAAQRDLGQPPLFMIRPGDQALDADLAARGYRLVDPVLLRVAPVASFAPPDPMRSFPHWPPLAMTRDIWAETGVGPARQAVMQRVTGPATALLARSPDPGNRAAGAAFVAVADSIAMIHALEVLPALRRQGSANQMLRSAACWAQQNGASWLALAVTRDNAGANQLYASLNMPVVGHYHYRSA